VYDRFAEKLQQAVEKLRIGDGLQDGVTTGPLIDETRMVGWKKLPPRACGLPPVTTFAPLAMASAMCSSTFLYVQDGVYDRFAEKLQQAVEKLRIGDGLQDGVTTGPLIDEKAVAKVEEHIADAIAKGRRNGHTPRPGRTGG
jgi:acyl-CoA reductase-like NAD-dependent aldehyde dehydrogenase